MFDSEQIKKIEAYIMLETGVLQSDIAFVFGTRHGVEEFCQITIELWKKGLFPKLIVSGGKTMGLEKSEASIISQRLIELGIDRKAILVEEESLNTGENVIFSRQLVEKTFGVGAVKSILAIGKICSSRRYLMTLKKHWRGARISFCPVNYFGVEKESWHQCEPFRDRVLSEYQKIPQYIDMGFLEELEHGNDQL